MECDLARLNLTASATPTKCFFRIDNAEPPFMARAAMIRLRGRCAKHDTRRHVNAPTITFLSSTTRAMSLRPRRTRHHPPYVTWGFRIYLYRRMSKTDLIGFGRCLCCRQFSSNTIITANAGNDPALQYRLTIFLWSVLHTPYGGGDARAKAPPPPGPPREIRGLSPRRQFRDGRCPSGLCLHRVYRRSGGDNAARPRTLWLNLTRRWTID